MAEFDGIPQVIANIADGNLRAIPVPNSPKVTLLGITDNTLVVENEPTLVRPSTNITMFDLSTGEPSELSKAIIEARDAGAQNIEVVVISKVATITAATRRTKLIDTFKLLLNHPLDIIVPVGANIDTPSQTASTNFAYQLASFCFKASKNFNSCIGVIGVEPPTPYASDSISLAEMDTWVTAMKTYDTSTVDGAAFTEFDGTTDAGADGKPDNFAFWATDDEAIPTGSPPSVDANVLTDANDNPIDIGKFISVVAGSYRFNNDIAKKVTQIPPSGGTPFAGATNGYYPNSGAAAYAGMIAALRPHSSPTKKVIAGPSVIRNLSITQADDLAQKRFVVFQQNAAGVIVVNAMTGAYNISRTYRSDYVRLTTMRITNEVVEQVRAVADPFLGEAFNGVAQNALDAELDQVLSGLVKLGALRRYEYNIISTPAMQVLGECTIDLLIVPAFELTEITLNVALRQE